MPEFMLLVRNVADHQTSWEVVYDLTAMKDIYTWMLAQHR